MTAKITTPLAARKTKARQALEADAAGMLLAGGYDTTDQAAAVAALLAEPLIGKAAYSVAEFCVMWGKSVATFRRKQKQGLTPVVHDVMGQPAILQESIDEWRANLKVIAAAKPTGQQRHRIERVNMARFDVMMEMPNDTGLGPLRPRARKVKAPPADKVDRRRRPSIFDPPTPHRPKRAHLQAV